MWPLFLLKKQQQYANNQFLISVSKTPDFLKNCNPKTYPTIGLEPATKPKIQTAWQGGKREARTNWHFQTDLEYIQYRADEQTQEEKGLEFIYWYTLQMDGGKVKETFSEEFF